MNTITLLGGVAHNLPADVETALTNHQTAGAAWRTLTPLARNEWICWIEDAKLTETRSKRLTRMYTELAQGKRRPCCWPGCIHRVKTGL